jgi:hypothetical protein
MNFCRGRDALERVFKPTPHLHHVTNPPPAQPGNESPESLKEALVEKRLGDPPIQKVAPQDLRLLINYNWSIGCKQAHNSY